MSKKRKHKKVNSGNPGPIGSQDGAAISQQDTSDKKGSIAPPRAAKETPRWKQILKVVGVVSGIFVAVITFLRWIDDQRPYVIADGPPQFLVPPNATGTPVSANVTLKNIGKTPAMKTAWFVDLLPYRATSRPDYLRFVENSYMNLRKQQETITGEHAAEMNRDIAPAATTFSTENSRALTAPEMADVEKGDGSFILLSVGIVRYTDSFRRSYETEFCYFFAGSDSRVWHTCDAHNTIR